MRTGILRAAQALLAERTPHRHSFQIEVSALGLSAAIRCGAVSFRHLPEDTSWTAQGGRLAKFQDAAFAAHDPNISRTSNIWNPANLPIRGQHRLACPTNKRLRRDESGRPLWIVS